jgi:DNA-binding PadR family transcriptional regulator
MTINQKQAEYLEHTLKHKRFYADASNEEWEGLVKKGYATKGPGWDRESAYFYLTDEGKEALRKYKNKLIEDRKVGRIEIRAGATIGKLQLFEIWFYDTEGKRFSSKYINIDHLKRTGVIKRSNSFKKAEAWLNTPEGLEWAVETQGVSI